MFKVAKNTLLLYIQQKKTFFCFNFGLFLYMNLVTIKAKKINNQAKRADGEKKKMHEKR